MRSNRIPYALALLVIALVFIGIHARHAGAQTSQDWKIFPGNMAVIRTCNFSPAPVANVSGTNSFSPFVSTAPAANTCTASIHLTRDHQATTPVSVQVHVTQTSVGQPHGVIGCQLIATNVKNNGNGTLSYRQGAGTVSTINYSSANVGIVQTMNLAMPGPFGDGGVYINGGLTVDCTVGNDFFVEDVTLVENGTD